MFFSSSSREAPDRFTENVSQGGLGPNAFGGYSQESQGLPPLSYDAEHDILAGLVRWVEEGAAPDSFVAAHYKDNNASQGVEFTRPLCKVRVTCIRQVFEADWSLTSIQRNSFIRAVILARSRVLHVCNALAGSNGMFSWN